MLPALLGGKSSRDHLVVQSNGIQRQAIRVGAWKYIPGAGGKRSGGGGGNYATNLHVQLYDLSKDISEENNLAEKMPDKVKECQALLTKIKTDGHDRP